MIDIFHPVLNNNSIFKIYQCKDESFLYSILAALYSKKIGKKCFINQMDTRNSKA